jgi:hypothetical protein
VTAGLKSLGAADYTNPIRGLANRNGIHVPVRGSRHS